MNAAQRLANGIISAIALVVIAAIPAYFAYHVFALYLAIQTDPEAYTAGPRAGGRIFAGGLFLGGIAIFLLIAAAKSIHWGISKPKLERDPDLDSWKDMPYPKD